VVLGQGRPVRVVFRGYTESEVKEGLSIVGVDGRNIRQQILDACVDGLRMEATEGEFIMDFRWFPRDRYVLTFDGIEQLVVAGAEEPVELVWERR